MNSEEAFVFSTLLVWIRIKGSKCWRFLLLILRQRWWSRFQLFDRIKRVIYPIFQWKLCSLSMGRKNTCITNILNVNTTLLNVLCSITLCEKPPTLQILIPRHYYFTKLRHVSSSWQQWQSVRSHKWRLFEDGSIYPSALFDVCDQPALGFGIWQTPASKKTPNSSVVSYFYLRWLIGSSNVTAFKYYNKNQNCAILSQQGPSYHKT